MKLLTAVAVIALATSTAAFADPGTSAPTNLNSANQSSSMQNQSMSKPDMQGQAGIQKPAQQGAANGMNSGANANASNAKSVKMQQGAMNNDMGKSAHMSKSASTMNSSKNMNGSKQDQAERLQTQQLNSQQLANASNMGGMGGQSMSPQTATKPPEDNKLNCVEGTGRCTPAIPKSDH